MKVAQPCFLRVTAVREQLYFRDILIHIGKESSACAIIDETRDEAPAETRDQDAMPIPTSGGLEIHWNNDTQPNGEAIAGWFDGLGFNVVRRSKLPAESKPTEIWIDIGPGSPWK
jgi:hypothetical protein